MTLSKELLRYIKLKKKKVYDNELKHEFEKKVTLKVVKRIEGCKIINKNVIKKIRPNHITFFAVLFSILGFYFLTQRKLIISSIFFIFDLILDIFDGLYARITKQTTAFGDWFDHSKDMIRNNSFFIGAALGNYITWQLAALLVFTTSSFVFSIVYAEKNKLNPHYLFFGEFSQFFIIGMILNQIYLFSLFILAIHIINLLINFSALTLKHF